MEPDNSGLEGAILQKGRISTLISRINPQKGWITPLISDVPVGSAECGADWIEHRSKVGFLTK